MTDKTDPRLKLLRRYAAAGFMWTASVDPLLDDLDAADRAAGIVRVDTNDEALVWHVVNERFPEWARSEMEADLVRAIFATLREAS